MLEPESKPPIGPGRRVGDWVVVGVLGKGGMATVYRARHCSLRREVALKVLTPHATGPLAARFDREAKNAARLDHPGCVRVHDFGATEDGLVFLVMEYLDGRTIGSGSRGPLTTQLQSMYFDSVRGHRSQNSQWLEPVA